MAISNRNVLSRQEKERQLAELMNRNRAMQVKQNKKTVAPQQPAKRDAKDAVPYAGSVAKNSKALDYESKAKQWDSSGFSVKAVKASSYTDENKKRQGLNYIINDNYKLANRGKYNQLDYLNDDEIKTVKHLVQAAGDDDYSSAYDYLDSIENVLNERMAISQTQKAGDFAKENNLWGAALSLVTGMAKPLGYLGALEQGIENFAEGKDELIDPNSPYFAGNRVSDAYAQGVMEDKSDLAKFLIGTGLSMGNQLMTLPMGAASLAFMGLQGAGDAAFDYAQKGIDTGKALLGATGSGAITYATERMLPIEQLFGLGDNARDVLAEGALKHIFKSALGEGVEEVVENVRGNAWDYILMGEKSDFSTLKNQLMEQGMTESEATLQAAKQLYVDNSIEGFLGGALSGGLMGGMGSGANYIRASRMGRQFNNPETVEELINTGSDVRAGSRAEILAAKNREKLDSKGRLSDADVGKQWIANQQAQAETEQEQEKINIRLRYRDIAGKDADTNVVDSLQKIFSGGALSNNEAEAIINDESGRKMFSEKTGVAIPENATMAQKRRAVKSFAERVASGKSQPVIIENQSVEESGNGRSGMPAPTRTVEETMPTKESAPMFPMGGKAVKVQPTRDSAPQFPWSSTPEQAQAIQEKKQIVSDRGVRFGERGRKAFSAAMKGRSGNAMDGAMKEFELYYIAGSAGLGMDSVERRGSLNDGEVYAAYQSGVNDSEFSKKNYEKKTAVKNENAGFNYDGSVNIEAVTADNLDKLGKAMGVKITVVDKLTDSQGNAVNGKYDSRKGEIILSADNENGIEFVALHEMVHRLRLQDRKTFYELGKQVMSYMQANNLLTGEVARQAQLYGLGKGDINYYDLLEEVVADFIGGEYDLQTVVGMFTDRPKSFVQKVIDLIDEIIDSIKKALGMDVPVDRLEDISRALKDAVRAGANKKAATGESDGVIKTDYKKAKTNTGIYEGMSDAERYEILKDKQLTVVNTEGFVLDEDVINEIREKKGGALQNVFADLAENLGLTKLKYANVDINFEVNLSKKGARESAKRTNRRNHASLAKSFHYFKEIVDNAILIEVHENDDKHKEDPSLILMYELLSGYNAEDGFVPVKFTVKEFKGKDAIIYATRVFDTIKKADILAQTSTTKSGEKYAPSASTISLAEIFRNVNKENSLYQYIPPQFFEGERYSYAGTRAAYAPDTFLQADRMRDFDYSDEDIRKETGWFKGADGRMRFEIDDSEMEVDLTGRFHRNPDIRRRQELEYKIYFGDGGTEADMAELQSLNKNLKGVNNNPKKLGDMVHHPMLFAQYPELEDLRVEFKDDLDARGQYDGKKITISKDLRLNKEQLKSTLIHEIQHWIQHYEGFSGGSNKKFWEEHRNDAAQRIGYRELQKRKKAMLQRYRSWPEGFQRLSEELDRARKRGDQERYDALQDEAWEKYEDEYDDYFMLQWDIETAEKNLNNDRYLYKAEDLYRNTAGEQEARDVQKRLNYTEEQRSAEKPFTGNERTVFVEDVRFSRKDNMGNQLSAQQQRYFADSKVRDANGALMVVYHQTDADFTQFRTKSTGAGRYDHQMPDGIFTKPADNDIGLKGKKQMALYANITNPLMFNNRRQAEKFWKDNIEGYDEAVRQLALLDTEYHEKYEAADLLDDEMYKTLRQQLRDKQITREEFSAGLEKTETKKILKEWEEKGNRLRAQAKQLINGYISASDYDGLIMENDQGSFGRRVKSIVAFSSNQLKNVTNANPTESEDIRFSMKQPVEETKNLIAVHNLTADKLSGAFNLGGFPAPSIAITKADKGHKDFGEISLLFRKDTIDPANNKNKVYSGDAWTPTFPAVEYQLNNAAAEDVRKYIDDLVPKKVQNALGGLHLDTVNVEDNLNRFGGDFATAYRRNYPLKYAYAMEKDINIDVPEKQASLDRTQMFDNRRITTVAEEVGKDDILRYRALDSREKAELAPMLAEKLSAEWKRRYENKSDTPAWILRSINKKPKYDENNFGFNQVDRFLNAAYKYFAEGITSELDYYAVRNIIDDTIDQQDYENWLTQTFAKVIGKRGLRNNKPVYTSSGNRRSFDALHYEVTLENIVRAMMEEGDKGVGAWGNGNIIGGSTVEYGSVDEIKGASARLKSLPKEEFAAMKKEFTDRFFEIASDMSTRSTEAAANLMVEAVTKYKTRRGIANYLKREGEGWTRYSDYIVDDLIELVNDIRSMPVEYFEAKPQRAVGFDEVAAAVVPDDMDAGIRAQLEQQGVKVLEYKAGDEADRLEKVNSVEDVRFSRKQKPDEDNRYTVSYQAVQDTAKKLIKEYAVNIKVTELADKLAVALDYMEEGFDNPDFNYETAMDNLRNVAKVMVDKAVVASTEYGGEYLEVKNIIREQPMYIDDQDKADLVKLLGMEKYSDFHKKYFGRMKLSKKGLPVNKVYEELNGMYPGLFTDDITTPAEQMAKIAEVYDKVSIVVNPYEGYEEEVIDTITRQLYDAYFEMPTTRTENEISQLKSKLKVARSKLKTANAKVAQLQAERRKLTKELKRKTQLADYFENQLVEEVRGNKLVNEILDIATQYRTWYKGGRDASYLKHPALENYIKELGKLKWRSDIRKASARKIMTVIGKFYTQDVLGAYYEPVVADRIKFVADNIELEDGSYNEAPLNVDELEAVVNVMKAVKKLYQEFDTVFIDDRRVNTRELARKEYDILDKYGRSDMKTKFFNYWANKLMTDGVFNAVESRVVYQILEGFHEDGVLKKLHDDMSAGVTRSNKLRIEMLRNRDEFLKKHKDYRRRLEKDKIKFYGVEMTVGQAITTYLTMHREEAQATLTSTRLGSGLVIRDAKGKVAEIQALTDVQRAIDKLGKLLTKEDKEFIRIARRIFNEEARQVKQDADMDILGFTNVSASKNYIPIKRSGDQIALAFSDVRQMVQDVASVYNFSFNKAVVQHSEKGIEIFDINALLDNHCGKVAMYAGLTKPLQTFDRVLNANITIDSDGKKYGERNLREKLNKIWKPVQKGANKVGGFHEFHSNLMQDVQSRGRGDSSRLVNRVKSNFASAALGANLKEIISQPTGYFMAYQYLSGEAMARGAAMANDYDSMMKYSDYAMVRDYDKGYLLSESLGDKVEGFAKKFGEPLDWADKYTMGKLWNACRVEVELTQGLKIGTEENYKAAAELLEKVGRLTQPNYDASEKSGFQRNKNEIISSFSMFSSVQTKQLSRIVESVTKYQMYKERAAKEPTEANKNAMAAAKEEMARCQAGILMMNAGYVLICTLVKAALPKKEEEKITDAMDLTKKMTSGMIESYVGIIPFADDAANMFIDGYDTGHFFYSSINDMASAIRGMKNIDKDPGKVLYNLAVATGQMTGIPTRNIVNILKGGVNRAASSMGTQAEYEGNKLLYKAFGGEKKTTYINLLYGALYDGDSDTAKYIIDDMVKRGYTKQSISTSLKTMFAQQAVEYWAEGDSENLQKVFDAMSLVGLSQKNISSQIQTQMKKRIVNDKAILKLAEEISRYRHSSPDWQASHRANLQAKIDKLIQEYAEKGYNQSVVTAAIESLLE